MSLLYSSAVKCNLLICKFLINLPIEICNHILEYLKNSKNVYLFHVNITKKIIKCIYGNNIANNTTDANITNITDIQLKQYIDYDGDNEEIINNKKNIYINNKLSKNKYTNQKIKKRLLKKREIRLKTLRKKYSIEFKKTRHLESVYVKDIDYIIKKYNIYEWEEVWECIDSGEYSFDSHGYYQYGELFERHYIYINNRKIKIVDDIKYSKYEKPIYNYLEYLNKNNRYGNEIEIYNI